MASIEPEMPMPMPMPLPEDVLMPILSRLPVKTLLRFKSVSKYWYSLSHNPSFISLHHNRAQPNDCLIARTQIVSDGPRQPDGTVLPDGNSNDDGAEFSVYLVPYETASPIQDLDLSFSGLYDGGDDVKGVFFLGCLNGIMCIANDVTSTIVIVNPATRESTDTVGSCCSFLITG